MIGFSLKAIFIVSVFATGFIEYIKNYLPVKFKENKLFLTIFSGVVSAATGVAYVFVAKPIFGVELDPGIKNFVVYAIGTIGTVQVSYELLLKTFKAIVERLKNKVVINTTVDPEKIADEVIEKVPETIESVLKKVPLKESDLKTAVEEAQ